MRGSFRLGSACLVFFALHLLGEAQTENLASLTKKLDAVRTRMLSAKAMANVESSVEPPYPLSLGSPLGPSQESKNTPARWAFSGEQRFRELHVGFPSSFDGAQFRVRYYLDPAAMVTPTAAETNPLSSRSETQVLGQITSARLGDATISPDPIDSGYKVALTNPDRVSEQFWLCQALRRVKPSIASLPNGNFELSWKTTAAGRNMSSTIELDPKRDYLIVLKEEEATLVLPTGRAPIWRRDRTRVIESKDMGTWHLPTDIIEEDLRKDGSASMTRKQVLSNVRTDVPDDLFTDVFEPGDLVRDGTISYRVLPDKSLQRIKQDPWEEQADKQTQKEYLLVVGSVAGAIAIAFLVAVGVKRSRGRRL